MQGTQVKIRWLILWISDPEVHVDEQDVAERARVNLRLGKFGSGRETVVQVDCKADPSVSGLCDHLCSFDQVVRDGLLNEHMLARS